MIGTRIKIRTGKALLALILSSLSCSRAFAQSEATVLTRAQIERLVSALGAQPPTNKEVVRGDYFAIKVAMLDHRSGPTELNPREDRIFVVLSGIGDVCVGEQVHPGRGLVTSERPPCRPLPMRAGSVISVPRGLSYRMEAPRSKVEFVVVRVIS